MDVRAVTRFRRWVALSSVVATVLAAGVAPVHAQEATTSETGTAAEEGTVVTESGSGFGIGDGALYLGAAALLAVGLALAISSSETDAATTTATTTSTATGTR